MYRLLVLAPVDVIDHAGDQRGVVIGLAVNAPLAETESVKLKRGEPPELRLREAEVDNPDRPEIDEF